MLRVIKHYKDVSPFLADRTSCRAYMLHSTVLRPCLS